VRTHAGLAQKGGQDGLSRGQRGFGDPMARVAHGVARRQDEECRAPTPREQGSGRGSGAGVALAGWPRAVAQLGGDPDSPHPRSRGDLLRLSRYPRRTHSNVDNGSTACSS
jgi:hypothetical protein